MKYENYDKASEIVAKIKKIEALKSSIANQASAVAVLTCNGYTLLRIGIEKEDEGGYKADARDFLDDLHSTMIITLDCLYKTLSEL
jgi:hypothetical protein